MRRPLLLIAFLLVAGCTTAPSIELLSPHDFADVARDPEVFVLDTHIPEQTHIAGTDAFIPYDELAEHEELLPDDKDTPIAVYCRSGSMSAQAALELQSMGYTKVYDLSGGANAWKDEGLPLSSHSFETAGALSSTMTMYKNPSCGCCVGHKAALEQAGFIVDVVEMPDISMIKQRHGIPPQMQSCHTIEVDGYFIEGHVPIETIETLLAERPAIDGIALPRMPAGTPGMPGAKREPWTIYSFVGDEIDTYEVV